MERAHAHIRQRREDLVKRLNRILELLQANGDECSKCIQRCIDLIRGAQRKEKGFMIVDKRQPLGFTKETCSFPSITARKFSYY